MPAYAIKDSLVKLFPTVAQYGKPDLELIGRRFVAWTIDWMLSNFIVTSIWRPLWELGLLSDMLPYTGQPCREAILLLYYATALSSPWQATVGMRFMQLRIQHVNGGKVEFHYAMVTYFVFSIYHLWYNRWSYILFLCGSSEMEIIRHDNVSEMLLFFLIQYGKWAVFVALYVPLCLSNGRQSLANIIGKTQVICTNRNVSSG